MFGLYLGRIEPPANGQQDPQPEGGKSGMLKVRYKGTVCWASPCYAWGRFTPPSNAWLTLYAEKFGVWIAPELDETGNEGAHLVYLGFKPYEETLPQDIVDAFPNKMGVLLGSDWEVVVDEKPSEVGIEIRCIDGTAMAGTPQEKPIKITITKAAKQLTIALDVVPVGKQGSIQITGVDKDTVTQLGDGAVGAAIGNRLQTMWGSLKTFVAGLQAPPGTAGGALVQTAGPFPNFDPKTVSTHLKLPDET